MSHSTGAQAVELKALKVGDRREEKRLESWSRKMKTRRRSGETLVRERRKGYFSGGAALQMSLPAACEPKD